MKRAVLLAIMGVLSATVFYAQEKKSSEETVRTLDLANVCAVFPIYDDGDGHVLYYCEETTAQECQPLDVVYAWGGRSNLNNVPDLCDDGCTLEDSLILSTPTNLRRIRSDEMIVDKIPDMARGQLTDQYSPRSFLQGGHTSQVFQVSARRRDNTVVTFQARLFGIALKPANDISFPTRHRRRFVMAFGIETAETGSTTIRGIVDPDDENKVTVIRQGRAVTVYRAAIN